MYVCVCWQCGSNNNHEENDEEGEREKKKKNKHFILIHSVAAFSVSVRSVSKMVFHQFADAWKMRRVRSREHRWRNERSTFSVRLRHQDRVFFLFFGEQEIKETFISISLVRSPHPFKKWDGPMVHDDFRMMTRRPSDRR